MSVCSKCKKPSEKLTGSLGGPMYCDECYVKPKDKKYFDYEAVGKTGGHVKYPTGICGICGHSIFMPTPTGIWIHYGYSAEDFENNEDHEPRLITVQEELLLENHNENKINGEVGSIHYYGTGYPRSKDRFTECLIHRKYWLKNFNITLEHQQKLVFQNPKFGIPKQELDNFLHYSQRPNVMKFKKFLTDKKIKALDKNPGMPTTYYEFFITKGRRYPESTSIRIWKESELPQMPIQGEKFKIDKKSYIVSSILNKRYKKTSSKDLIEVYLKTK